MSNTETAEVLTNTALLWQALECCDAVDTHTDAVALRLAALERAHNIKVFLDFLAIFDQGNNLHVNIARQWQPDCERQWHHLVASFTESGWRWHMCHGSRTLNSLARDLAELAPLVRAANRQKEWGALPCDKMDLDRLWTQRVSQALCAADWAGQGHTSDTLWRVRTLAHYLQNVGYMADTRCDTLTRCVPKFTPMTPWLRLYALAKEMSTMTRTLPSMAMVHADGLVDARRRILRACAAFVERVANSDAVAAAIHQDGPAVAAVHLVSPRYWPPFASRALSERALLDEALACVGWDGNADRQRLCSISRAYDTAQALSFISAVERRATTHGTGLKVTTACVSQLAAAMTFNLEAMRTADYRLESDGIWHAPRGTVGHMAFIEAISDAYARSCTTPFSIVVASTSDAPESLGWCDTWIARVARELWGEHAQDRPLAAGVMHAELQLAYALADMLTPKEPTEPADSPACIFYEQGHTVDLYKPCDTWPSRCSEARCTAGVRATRDAVHSTIAYIERIYATPAVYLDVVAPHERDRVACLWSDDARLPAQPPASPTDAPLFSPQTES